MDPQPAPYRSADLTPPKPMSRWRWWSPQLVATGSGIAYGILARVAFGSHLGAPGRANSAVGDMFAVMSVAFLFGVPLAIGIVYVLRFPRELPVSWGRAVVGAMGTSLLAVLATMVLAYEGSICIAMAAPVFAVLAGIGGLIGYFVRVALRPADGARNALLSVAALFPFLVAPVEHLFAPPTEVNEARNEVRVRASPEAVWREIRSVRRIRRDELPATVSHAIGLPRPVEATLSHDGVGGVRIATFERGLSFREEVTTWEPGRTLAFSIRAETAPATALDEHVTVGGPYFDVLEGTYTLETRGPRDVVLRLASRQRLSTRFNGYAGLWTRFVMRDLQQAILTVIRARAEAQPEGPAFAAHPEGPAFAAR